MLQRVTGSRNGLDPFWSHWKFGFQIREEADVRKILRGGISPPYYPEVLSYIITKLGILPFELRWGHRDVG